MKDSPLNFGFLESATESLRAIAHPHRLLIVEMLFKQQAMNVSEIHEQLGIEQAVASHHLRILKDRGIVSVRRDGKNSYYTLTKPDYYAILEVLIRTIGE
ncbi:MAG: ArsR family transcriptional regulator [Bacteroidetes bacterium]|nr:ArsR family transcriptional regulator [Bacteroidota bacterium]